MPVRISISTTENSQQFKGEGLPPQSRFAMSDGKKLFICSLGIFVCYFYYGILQEKITRVPYGESNERFNFAVTLVCIQCIINSIFAVLVIKLYYYGQEDQTSNVMYVCCSLSYLGAMLASNKSLQFVNYPTQVLGKSCKPIPVMILGALFAKKRYNVKKYICVLLIVVGVALFLYNEKMNTSKNDHRIGFGELLLLSSLFLDGVTGACQEKMRSLYTTHSHHMMLSVNKWSFMILGTVIVVSGELWTFIAFCGRYPFVIWNILAFSIMSALGQNFIFVTVSSFGPLPCSIATTTRKFFTILCSVIFFGNSLLTRQWFAVFLVFLGLGLDSYLSKFK